MFDLIRAVPPFVAESAGLSQFDSRFTLREKVSICGAITAFVAWMVLVVWPLPSYLYAIPFLLLMSGLLMFSDFAPTPSSRPSVRVIDTALGFLIVIYICGVCSLGIWAGCMGWASAVRFRSSPGGCFCMRGQTLDS